MIVICTLQVIMNIINNAFIVCMQWNIISIIKYYTVLYILCLDIIVYIHSREKLREL